MKSELNCQNGHAQFLKVCLTFGKIISVEFLLQDTPNSQQLTKFLGGVVSALLMKYTTLKPQTLNEQKHSIRYLKNGILLTLWVSLDQLSRIGCQNSTLYCASLVTTQRRSSGEICSRTLTIKNSVAPSAIAKWLEPLKELSLHSLDIKTWIF